ncbi:dienelactone hydrolase family protein [Rouxiella sp. Mn2063]|uniref:dienelactone hydrolase family protein n=1 Tax=Rouxiella sp. Mn2063 TaxID=3395262 RepID=UPI003BC70B43
MSNISVELVNYQVEGQTFQGRLVFRKDITEKQPGLLMTPNWMGATDDAVTLVTPVVEKGYAVFIADLYGEGVRPTNAEEATAAMMSVRDQPAERLRTQAALDALLSQQIVAVDKEKVAAFGFCFGGHNVLELARSGADLKAFVSFHGSLDTTDTAGAKNIKGAVLVLHGASDPLVPDEQVQTFVKEMKAQNIDWQLVSFGGAVHSFTDPHANAPGFSQYNEKVSKRAFDAMFQLFEEVL